MKNKKTSRPRPDLGKARIVSAPADKVAELGDLIDRILAATGHPEAYVTDESTMSDFFELGLDREGKAREIARVRALLGVQLSAGDHLFEIAMRMRDNRKEA